MLTKQEKIEQVEMGQKLFKQNRILIFADFAGIGVEDLKNLKKKLSENGAQFKVMKKRLMRIVFEKMGVDFNPEQFDGQVGVIVGPKDIFETIAPVYKFSKEKEKKGFKILGAYDLPEKNFFDAVTAIKIGKLPTREILLAQLVGLLSMPIKMFMHVLGEKAKQTVEAK